MAFKNRNMISVCMATYNGEKFLREQIDSILLQLRVNDELIISDDGSTDNTIRIIESYKDDRIKFFKNLSKHGVNSNFENAIYHAKGDFIFLSDQDDVWLPGKVDACVNALKNADCVIHDAIVVDKDLNIITESFFEIRNSGSGFWKNLYKNTYVGCCMSFRKSILEYVLPYPSNLPIFQEGWIAMLAELNGRVAFINIKGILFRRHSSNTSCTVKKSTFSRVHQLSYRVKLLWLIINRQFKVLFGHLAG